MIVCFYGRSGSPSTALTASGDTVERQAISRVVTLFGDLRAAPPGPIRCRHGDGREEFVRFQYANGDAIRIISHPTGCALVNGSWSRNGFFMSAELLNGLALAVD